MTKIGLLSDTHGFLDERIFEYFRDCNEIWHAGDIGSIDVANRLSAFKPLRAVYGNIDGQDVRISYPESVRFMCENADIFIKHIGGSINYQAISSQEFQTNPEQISDIFH